MHHRITLLSLLLVGCSPDSDLFPDDSGQPSPQPGTPDGDRLFGHVATLASASYAGREPGSDGGGLAEAYLEAHHQALGLAGAGTDGFRQPFPLERYTLTGPASLSIAGSGYQQGQDFEILTYSGAGVVEEELVFVGYGLTVPPFDPADYPGCPLDPAGYDDYQGLDLEGRIALMMRHGPGDDWDMGDNCPANEAAQGDGDLFTFGYKAANAALHGASAMLLFTDYQHGDGAADVGTIGEAYYQPELPALYVGRAQLESHLPELADWAAALDASLTPAPVATGEQASVSVEAEVSTVTVPNILATIPGVDPDLGDEVVIVGAHFDHLGTDGAGNVYPGADDNASGTAVVLELAQLFAEWGVQPARTLVFAHFNAEELGLVGSMYYIIEPPFPIDRTVAMLNLDMVGAGDEVGFIDFGGTEDGSEHLYDLLATQQSEDFPVTPLDSSPNSDHAWFQYAGVPVAFLFTIGAHADYHSPADTIEIISQRELEESARLSWDTLRILAMGEEDAVLDAAANTRRAPAPSVPPGLVPPGPMPARR